MGIENLSGTENHQVNFSKLKELYKEVSDEFEKTLNEYTIQVYYKIHKEFQNKCKIQELSRGEGFVNYVVKVGGHTCYISQVEAGYVAPGEISEDADGNFRAILNPNNCGNVNAAIVEGLFGKEIEEISMIGGNHLTLISNISVRSTLPFGINPREVYNHKDQMNLLFCLIDGIQNGLEQLGIKFPIESLNDYFIEGREIALPKSDKTMPDIYAGPPGAGKTTTLGEESNIRPKNYGLSPQNISDYEVLNRIKNFILAKIQSEVVNETEISNFIIHELFVNGFDIAEGGPQFSVFLNLGEKLRLGMQHFANDVQTYNTTSEILREPYIEINSWIRYIAEFVVYSGIDINSDEFQVTWEPILTRIINLFLTVFPDNKFKVFTEQYSLDEKELERRPTARLHLQEFGHFYSWLSNFMSTNYPNRLLNELNRNPKFDPESITTEWLRNQMIADGFPKLLQIFNLNWLITKLKNGAEINWSIIELPEYIPHLKLFFDLLTPTDKDKVILPAVEMIKIFYDKVNLSADLFTNISKEELFERIHNPEEIQKEHLARFGPSPPLILNFIDEYFEFIKICLILEARIINVLPKQGDMKRVEHTRAILDGGSIRLVTT